MKFFYSASFSSCFFFFLLLLLPHSFSTSFFSYLISLLLPHFSSSSFFFLILLLLPHSSSSTSFFFSFYPIFLLPHSSYSYWWNPKYMCMKRDQIYLFFSTAVLVPLSLCALTCFLSFSTLDSGFAQLYKGTFWWCENHKNINTRRP